QVDEDPADLSGGDVLLLDGRKGLLRETLAERTLEVRHLIHRHRCGRGALGARGNQRVLRAGADGEQDEKGDQKASHRQSRQVARRKVSFGMVKKGIGALVALQLMAAALPAQTPVDSLFPTRPTGMVTDVAGVI